MILAIDIGNTNIVVGGYDGDRLAFSVRLSTDATRTAYEYAATLGGVLGLYQVDLGAVTGAIVSSVVPPLSGALCQAVALLCPGVEPLLVGAGMRTGLNIRIDNPKELGADLLAASVAIAVKAGVPREKAIPLISGSAAGICGIGDRVGRIAPGLDGDILIFEEDPIGLLIKPEHIFVDGKQLR